MPKSYCNKHFQNYWNNLLISNSDTCAYTHTRTHTLHVHTHTHPHTYKHYIHSHKAICNYTTEDKGFTVILTISHWTSHKACWNCFVSRILQDSVLEIWYVFDHFVTFEPVTEFWYYFYKCVHSYARNLKLNFPLMNLLFKSHFNKVTPKMTN